MKLPSRHAITSLVAFIILATSCSDPPASSPSLHENWFEELTLQNYSVSQGNAYLMQNEDCPIYVDLFDSCFGQNPAAPYIIPQPPIGDDYVNPDYAEPLNTSGPDGLANIIYRLSDNDALVTIISYPPKEAYLGYQSYVFTRDADFYEGITSSRERTVSPDPDRYEIFGSLGDDINSILVEDQFGEAPWGGNLMFYITTSNENLANDLIELAVAEGIDPNAIFVEPVGSNVITGSDADADDLITLIRYAIPESDSAVESWQNELESNVLVYKVTNTEIPVSSFDTNQYTAHTVNTDETSLSTALEQLTALLETYLEDNQLLTATAQSHQTETTVGYDADGIPTSGLVGDYCIATGTNCEGDNQDTSTYAFLLDYVLFLGVEETAFIAGVNHSEESVNNSLYVSVAVYNAENSSGVAGSSQTNPDAAGFDSGVLNGSAEQVLTDLGIDIPSDDVELAADISKLYVTFIARNCDNSTIAAASDYCIDLDGISLLALEDPISIAERSYIVPGTTTGGYAPGMVYPWIVAASFNFVSE